MMRILITGGAGSLGSNIVDSYMGREDVKILVIDNFSTGSRRSIPLSPSIEIVQGSVADATLIMSCFERFKPTHVIHCAASYKDPDDWEGDAETNISGTINVARGALAYGAKRLVNFQTSLCYGVPRQLPIPIDHPLVPITSYSISKTAGEQYLLMSDLNVVSFRLATVLAPRFAIGPVPTFYQRLKAGKDCFCSATVRDFMDLSDFLDLLDKALADDAPSGIFNASPGVGVSIKQIFDAVAEYLKITIKKEPPIVSPGADDVPEVVLDSSKTEKAFGWRVRTSFDDTIKKMLDWYDENGVPATYSHVRKPDMDNGHTAAKHSKENSE